MFANLEGQLDSIRAKGYRPIVVGCLVCDSKVLLVYKAKHDLWQLPQGGVESKESLTAALQRELAEELGSKFDLDNQSLEYLGTEALKLPARLQGSRELKTELGADVKMIGKKYFFFALKVASQLLELAKTEFDDFRWLSYSEAYKQANKIYQPGKKRITLKALALLQDKSLIK